MNRNPINSREPSSSTPTTTSGSAAPLSSSSSRAAPSSVSTSTSPARGPSRQEPKPRTDAEVREAVGLDVSFTEKQYTRKKPEPWTDDEVNALKRGLSHYNAPLWAAIRLYVHPALQKRTNMQLKDKARTELKKLERQGKTERSQLGVWQYVK